MDLPILSTTCSAETLETSDTKDAGDGKSKLTTLSPSTQAKLQFFLDSIEKQEAYFGEDSHGRPTIEYRDKKKLHWDASNANKVHMPREFGSQEQKQDHKQTLLDTCLEHIEYLKKHKSPKGVVLDKSKVTPSKSGQYDEGSEFIRTKEILGKGNSAGDIVVIRDQESGSRNALKTIMISVFREEEIRAWVDLNDTGYVPCLYSFKLNNNKVDVIMEPLEKAISLNAIIEEHIWTIRGKNPALVKPFSLYMFHGLMTAAQTMHEKGWTHRDLHSGNVMVQKGSEVNVPLKIRVLDFGSAGRLYDQEGSRGFRMDIEEVVRKFTALYAGNEFESGVDIRRDENRDAKLNEFADFLKISREERTEIFSLIDTALRINSLPELRDFQKELETKLPSEQEMNKVMKEVVPLLFAQFEYQSVHPKKGTPGLSSMDAGYVSHSDRVVSDSCDGDQGQMAVSDDVVEYFRQTIRIG